MTTQQPEALRLADVMSTADADMSLTDGFIWVKISPTELDEAAAELRRLHEEVEMLRGDPGNRYAHRLAIELECAILAPEQTCASTLLDEYHTAVREWMEANGQPYVSGFGKD
jgi:hypothetical protein